MRQIFFLIPTKLVGNYEKTIILQRLIMKLTNKGKYAVMAMADLASNSDEGPISLAEISIRQNISLSLFGVIFLKN